MALKEVKDRVVAQLQAVAGAGAVSRGFPNLKEEADLIALLDGNKVLNCAFVTSGGSQYLDEDVNQHLVTEKRTVVIHVFLAVNQAADSESAFDALVDAYVAALMADRRPPSKLGGTIETSDAPSLSDPDYRVFGPGSGVLCHHAEVRMAVSWRDMQ